MNHSLNGTFSRENIDFYRIIRPKWFSKAYHITDLLWKLFCADFCNRFSAMQMTSVMIEMRHDSVTIYFYSYRVLLSCPIQVDRQAIVSWKGAISGCDANRLRHDKNSITQTQNPKYTRCGFDCKGISKMHINHKRVGLMVEIGS